VLLDETVPNADTSRVSIQSLTDELIQTTDAPSLTDEWLHKKYFTRKLFMHGRSRCRLPTAYDSAPDRSPALPPSSSRPCPARPAGGCRPACLGWPALRCFWPAVLAAVGGISSSPTAVGQPEGAARAAAQAARLRRLGKGSRPRRRRATWRLKPGERKLAAAAAAAVAAPAPRPPPPPVAPPGERLEAEDLRAITIAAF
jgi:hypothetical protein